MERNRQKVRNLAKRERNRLCFDCQRNGPQSDVVLPVGIFICGRCAGLHRSIEGHKVSTIQMARFTNEDVEQLEAGGNRRARRKFLAKYPIPGAPTFDASDDQKMDKFIQAVWKDLLFYDPHNPRSPSTRRRSSVSRSKTSSVAASVPFPEVSSQTFQSAFGDAKFGDSSSSSSTGANTPAHSPQPPKSISGGKELGSSASVVSDMDFLSGSSASSPAAQQQRQTPASSSSSGGSSSSSNFETGLESIFDSPPVPSPSTAAPASQPQSNGLGPVDLMTGYMRQVLKQHSLTREEFLTVVQDSLTRLKVPWQQPQTQTRPAQSAKINPLDAYAQSKPFSYAPPPSQQQRQQLQPHQPHPSQQQTLPATGDPYGDLGDPFGGPSNSSQAHPAPGFGDVFGGGLPTVSPHQPHSQQHDPISLVDSLSRPPAQQPQPQYQQPQHHADDIFGNLMGSSGQPLHPKVTSQAPKSNEPPPVDHFSMLNPFQ